MRVMNEACITGAGAFLPGDPVDNEQLSARFAPDTPRAVKLLSRLRQDMSARPALLSAEVGDGPGAPRCGAPPAAP